MNPARTRKPHTIRNSLFAAAAGLFLLACLAALIWFAWEGRGAEGPSYEKVATFAGIEGAFSEPFGLAEKGGYIYMSDGETGKIWRMTINDASYGVLAVGLDTPSAIAFDVAGNLIVADSGSHTIKSINPKGVVTVIAGVEGQSGFADGDAATALFNAPIGLATGTGRRIFVADTYNDRIRVIENGKVSTLAGSTRGYADGPGDDSKFDTPCGLGLWQDKLLVADTGNRRIRAVEPDGIVRTFAGSGEGGLVDGLLSGASFVHPTAIAVETGGRIFIADGNAIRQIDGKLIQFVSTVAGDQRGFQDGSTSQARFSRPSGIVVDRDGGLLVADSDNALVRRLEHENLGQKVKNPGISAPRRLTAEGFRERQPPRWPYDPPDAKRDIAGTLGEIRGEMTADDRPVWFHNGLDIAGAYGETARFVRDEKVLRPVAAENFGNQRELLRMPTIGYIHIRLGRSDTSVPLGDARFQFTRDALGKITGVRVARGTRFRAGEPIGTLNELNHVHLIAGESGSEMNALDALILPNLTDSRSPTIEKVTLRDENSRQIDATPTNSRIRISGKTQIVVRAYDQTQDSSARRRLGVYRLGYQVLGTDGSPAIDTTWTIIFDRMPASEAIRLVYANGSRSGATGETIFDYIVTNHVSGDEFREDFLDAGSLAAGNYTLRVFAADYFGNITTRDVPVEVPGH